MSGEGVGYYPILLEMTGRPCLVVGGGPVAERKATGLLAAGARVTVVSPALCPGLEVLALEGRLQWRPREYRVGDLAGFALAMVATDDGQVNEAVAGEGREQGVWVNAADDPAHCDFTLPSVLRRGELVVAVATGGASPALSRLIREELEAYFTEDYTALADVAGEVRRELRQLACRPDAEAWRTALDADLRRLIAEGKLEEAKAHLLERLGAGICG